MQQEVKEWMQSGADPAKGIELLEKYSENVLMIRLAKTDPANNVSLIKDSLCRLAKIEPVGIVPSVNVKPVRESFREEFPFLDQPDCPFELKALVTDKFSSFNRYKKLHAELSDCATLEECAKKSAELLAAYRENRAIYDELHYYQQHKSVLGKHPVFGHYNHLKELQGMSVRELIKKEAKLLHNIWRIESEIEKGDKPALKAERLQRLEMKKNELAEVRRLLV